MEKEQAKKFVQENICNGCIQFYNSDCGGDIVNCASYKAYIAGATEETKLLVEENKELKELVEKYRQATDKILHITFMGGGCEVNTIGQYATLVDGYLTDVEGLAKWKN